jgi:predicted nucleic acid-binding protein
VKVFLDTNVLIAAFVQDHEHHTRALPLMQKIHAGHDQGFVSAHALLEVYAILTRLPRSPRIMPPQAATLIETNILGYFTVSAVAGREYGDLVRKLGQDGIVGGQAYDALHMMSAEKAGVERIFTFNVRHFTGVAPHLSNRIASP